MAKQPLSADVLNSFFTKQQLQCIVGACMVENRELRKNLDGAIGHIRQLQQSFASINTQFRDLNNAFSRLKTDLSESKAGRAHEC